MKTVDGQCLKDGDKCFMAFRREGRVIRKKGLCQPGLCDIESDMVCWTAGNVYFTKGNKTSPERWSFRKTVLGEHRLVQKDYSISKYGYEGALILAIKYSQAYHKRLEGCEY